MEYIVGVAQFKPQFLDLEQNIKKMVAMLQGAKADLIVFPELATSGYVFSDISELENVSESAKTGPTAQTFTILAKHRNCSFVVGFVEKANGKYYNSSMLVNPDGTIHIYRKVHLFYEEKKFFTPGDLGFNVFEAKDDVKVGLMICFDWTFPESARTLSLKGAEILAHSANLVLPWCQQAMITRSLENRVFSITSNRTGTETNGAVTQTFTGMSQILGNKGEILVRMNETDEKIELFTIDPSLANDKAVTDYNDAFTDRREDMYWK